MGNRELVKEGSLVRAPHWDELVKVVKVERRGGGRVSITWKGVHSGRTDNWILREEELAEWEVISDVPDFSGNPRDVFLLVEAERFRYASLFDPLLAVNVSKVDALPFQIEAVYGYVLKQPRIRFLLADDPGAGKTIMAGLIMKELKLRGLARRILIVSPGHLKDQWQRELKEKFDENFRVVDRSTLESHYGENPWAVYNQVITSIDFAKQEEKLRSLNSVEWDLVVVDEAHKMAAYQYSTNKIEKTQRYKLGEILSETSTHLLFLTATPHKGDPENFRLFLDLLMPGFFATHEMVEESLRNKDNPLFIRRLKEDLKDFDGKPIFTRRSVRTSPFILSQEETELYNAVSRYVVRQYQKSLEEKFSGQSENKRRNVTFALMTLQRRMASSTYALLKSLKRRKKKLEEHLDKGITLPEKDKDYDIEDWEDADEQRKWEVENKWETLTFARNRTELIEEIQELNELIRKAEQIIDEEKERKLSELKKAIKEGFQKIQEMGGNRKILIFTESRDTLEYLVKKIQSWGYKVNYIHGGMKMEDRVLAEKIFRDETEIMVATEAAGEGINLQFCHILINYDIPWNPNRLEQRIGRIHRYGQQKDVSIFNLVAVNTVEGRILERLFKKIEEIQKNLGSDRVFDVIGEVFGGKSLQDLIVEAIVQARSMDEILQELEIQLDEEYLARIREVLGESLATKYIDYSRIQEMREQAEENRLVPEYMEEFFKRAFQRAGGEIHELGKNLVQIRSIPWELWKKMESDEYKMKYGIGKRSYPKATFDKEVAFKNPDTELISFGHPLLEALLDWVIEKFQGEARKGALFQDPTGRLDGYIWFYIGEVKDGKGQIVGRKILALYEGKEGVEEINPAILWELLPGTDSGGNYLNEGKEPPTKILDDFVEKYKEEIKRERERQAEVKRKYGLKSLEYLIQKLDNELLEMEERARMGEKINQALRKRKEEQLKKYRESRKELEKEIEKEKYLMMSEPTFLTVIRVVPGGDEMVESEEIERIGMEVAMAYEWEQGREPKDVSREYRGYDIYSTGENDEVRYIEVKARAGEGEVFLTPNEWLKAERYKAKYYLYVVSNAVTNPTLHIIQNPAERLKVQEKFEVIGYVVPSDEWKAKKIEEWKKK